MQTNKKLSLRILSAALTATMAMTMLPMAAFAADEVSSASEAAAVRTFSGFTVPVAGGTIPNSLDNITFSGDQYAIAGDATWKTISVYDNGVASPASGNYEAEKTYGLMLHYAFNNTAEATDELDFLDGKTASCAGATAVFEKIDGNQLQIEFQYKAAVVPAPAGYTTNENGLMAYKFISYYETDTLDLRGIFDGKWKKTTYANGGLSLFVKQGDGTPIAINSSTEPQSVPGIDGMTVKTAADFVNNGKHLKFSYTVENATDAEISYSIGIGGDVQIGADDYAAITKLDEGRGFKMVSAEDADKNVNGEYAQFNFFGRGVAGATDVTDFWYGWLDNYGTMAFGTEASIVDGTYDSGMGFSWKDQTLGAHATATYSVLIGIGGAGSESDVEETNSVYTISFDVNAADFSGAAPAAAQTNAETGKLASLPTLTRDGYSFAGWFTAAEGGTEITTDTVFTANTTVYAQWTKNSSGGGSSGGSTNSTPIVSDGKTVGSGTVETKNGTTTVAVDERRFGTGLSSMADGSTISIAVPGSTDAAAVQFSAKSVTDMAAKNVVLELKHGNASYTLPTNLLDASGLVSKLGADDASKVSITTNIKSASDVKPEGVTVVGTPVSFSVSASYNDTSVTVDSFDSLVKRSIAITKEQAAKVATAVVVDKDGTVRHVPTRVFEKDGNWYASISSMTDGTFALIEGKSRFTDVEGQWYADVANELSARKVTDGVFGTTFEGDKTITRAEFAALLVNAAGLPQAGTADYDDVSADAWYATYVATGTKYGVLKGIGHNLYDPDALITRQEAMTMMTRASKVIDYAGKSGDLAAFSDANLVSDWATEAAQFNVGSGLIIGNDGALKPHDNITRAESAVVVLRMLQQSGLVDVKAQA